MRILTVIFTALFLFPAVAGTINENPGDSCTKLLQQVPELEEWIDIEAAGNEPFIVLNDFIRCFNIENDDVWAEIDYGQSTNADLTIVTRNKCLSCWGQHVYAFYLPHGFRKNHGPG